MTSVVSSWLFCFVFIFCSQSNAKNIEINESLQYPNYVPQELLIVGHLGLIFGPYKISFILNSTEFYSIDKLTIENTSHIPGVQSLKIRIPNQFKKLLKPKQNELIIKVSSQKDPLIQSIDDRLQLDFLALKTTDSPDNSGHALFQIDQKSSGDAEEQYQIKFDANLRKLGLTPK